jgi:hypothetical protein
MVFRDQFYVRIFILDKQSQPVDVLFPQFFGDISSRMCDIQSKSFTVGEIDFIIGEVGVHSLQIFDDGGDLGGVLSERDDVGLDPV